MNAEQLLKIMDSKMEELKCYFRFIVQYEIKNIISTNDLLKRLEREKYEKNQLCSSAVKSEKTTGLSFAEALNLIKQGKLVKRINWRNIHLGLIKGSNEIAKIDGFSMCIIKILKLEDYEANDWEIVE